MSTLGFGACGAGSSGVTTGGVLAQLIALGAADTHLSLNPTNTFWRTRVQKATNYAMESILQTFTGGVGWGQEVQITINRTGDLIYWMYVLIDIPAIAALQSPSAGVCSTRFPVADACDPCGDGAEPNTCVDYIPAEPDAPDDVEGIDSCTGLQTPFANWVNEIGHAALDRVCFSIGGQVIDTLYSHFLHMWEELSGQPGKRLEEMIGKRFTRAALVADSQRARRLYVPLPFYFTRHSGNALPLVSLQFHSVQINVAFANIERMIQVSDCDVTVVKCSDGQAITSNDISAVLDTTYIYLDMDERDRFAVGSFQQLITQLQQFSTTATGTNIRAQLNFNHPTIELIWAVQRKCQADANNTFNYSGFYGLDPVLAAGLRINNLPRFSREGAYFRMVQPYEKHSLIPKSYVYNYGFALHPEDCQPSGSLNFSRIDNVEMNIDLQPELSGETVSLIVFCRNWNLLRFKEGLGGVLFSN